MLVEGGDTSGGLFAWLAEVSGDPLAFTMGAYPWGQAGTTLEKFDGPDVWSRDLFELIRNGLLNPAEAIQVATASGHGVGKSATVAWIILWAFCTFPDCRGVITANTETQLKTKTWAELGKWFNLCWFTREHFTLTATALFSKDVDRERTWRIDMIPWSEKNPAAFAGLHNQGKRLLLIFDEASEIADIIWETAEGALTDLDTQIIWLVFGNPTRNFGRFRECFPGGKFVKYWRYRQIDSRAVKVVNKAWAARIIEQYGEDNDRTRIRVLGQFPRVGEMEFFSSADIDAAMSPDREVYVDAFTPLAVGVDVARFGANNSVIFPRKGRDARSIARRVYNGLNTVELANKVHDVFYEWHPDGIFIDGGGVGGGVVDNCRNQRLHVIEVQFGGKDDITGVVFDNMGERYANKRSAMAGALRAWMKSGTLPFDENLRTAMLAIKYVINKQDQIQLVSKEEIMEDHPDLVLDDLDALFCTFGGPLARNPYAGSEFGSHKKLDQAEYEYDPYDMERMLA